MSRKLFGKSFPYLRYTPFPSRRMSPFRYVGGKSMLAYHILPWLDWGEVYVEPFCGGASVFWQKEPHPVEVLNDINEDIVNVFRCLQDKKLFWDLARRIAWTPYSKAEFERAKQTLKESSDPVDRAWALVVASSQSVNGNLSCWSRSFVSRGGMSSGNSRWRGRIAILRWWHDRLTRVQLDCRDALEVIQYWDSPKTIFYLDPPYLLGTRKGKSYYRFELTDLQHRELLSLLLKVKGNVVLSSYSNELYDSFLRSAGWEEIRVSVKCPAPVLCGADRKENGDGSVSSRESFGRDEVLWISPGLVKAVGRNNTFSTLL